MNASLRRRYLVPLLALLAFVAFGMQAPRIATGDANNPDVIPTFIDALNRGDINSALQVASPNLTLKLANGVSVPISVSTPVPAPLLPITIVSLTPEGTGTQTVDAVLTFGSDPTQRQVQFRGEGGVIVSISVVG